MAQTRRRLTGHWWRGAAAIAVGAALALAPSGLAAAADAVTARADFTGPVLWLDNTKGDREPVVLITLSFAENRDPSIAYCIDVNRDLVRDVYTETAWANSNRSPEALAKIQWLLTHGYPAVSATKLLTDAGVEVGRNADQVAYAATQAAIWSYSDADKFALRLSTDGRQSPVELVYSWLRAHVGTGTEPAPSLVIEPATKSGPLGTKLGPYTVKGADVTLTATDGSAVDAAGNPVTQVPDGGTFWLTRTTVGTVKVEAAGVAKITAGRVFTRPNAQTVILATPASVRLKAAASGTLVAVPTLPVTGSSVLLAIVAGLVLLGGGGLLILVARRRRVQFTH